jgi:hypothetical protein
VFHVFFFVPVECANGDANRYDFFMGSFSPPSICLIVAHKGIKVEEDAVVHHTGSFDVFIVVFTLDEYPIIGTTFEDFTYKRV